MNTPQPQSSRDPEGSEHAVHAPDTPVAEDQDWDTTAERGADWDDSEGSYLVLPLPDRAPFDFTPPLPLPLFLGAAALAIAASAYVGYLLGTAIYPR